MMTASHTNTDDSIECIASDVADLDSDDNLVTVLTDLVEEVTDLRSEVDELRAENRDLRSEVDELKEHTARQSRGLAETRQDLNNVEQAVEAVEQADTEDDTSGSHGDVTPVERLSQADNVTEVTDSASVERAVSLFRNLCDWGSKTPKGVVLRPDDNPRRLLEADRDEDLAWKQYYRAAQALERLSQGAVTFFDSDRHGKMLVLHEQSDVYSRVVDGSLTVSSVEVET